MAGARRHGKTFSSIRRFLEWVATSAAQTGKSDRSIKNQTRHKTGAMLAEYVREGRLFDLNTSEGLGL